MLLSGPVRSGSAFRARFAAVALAFVGLLSLPGCWVSSLGGLSEAGAWGTDKDQVSEPDLLGAWTSDCVMLEVTADDKQYHWTVTGDRHGCQDNKGEIDHYEGKLFKLGDHEFLDMTARDNDVCPACLAVHWIFKVDVGKDSLSLAPIDWEWLENAEKEKTVRLATAHGNPDLLTASPKELKEFCRKYGEDEAVFISPAEFTFERKQP